MRPRAPSARQRQRSLAERSRGVGDREDPTPGRSVDAHALGGLTRGRALVEADVGRVEARQQAAPLRTHRVRGAVAVTRQKVGGERAGPSDEAMPLGPGGDVAPVDALAQRHHLRGTRRRRGGDHRLDAQPVSDERDERVEVKRLLQDPPDDVQDAPALARRLDRHDLDVGRPEAEEHRRVDAPHLVPPTPRAEVDDPAVRCHHGDALAVLEDPVPRPGIDPRPRERHPLARLEVRDGALTFGRRPHGDRLERRHGRHRRGWVRRGRRRGDEILPTASTSERPERDEQKREGRTGDEHAASSWAFDEGVDKLREIDQFPAPHERGRPRAASGWPR